MAEESDDEFVTAAASTATAADDGGDGDDDDDDDDDDGGDDDNEAGTCVLRCLMILRSLVRVSGVIIVFVSWDKSSDRVRDSVWVCVILWRLDKYASTVSTGASVIV